MSLEVHVWEQRASFVCNSIKAHISKGGMICFLNDVLNPI